LTLAFRSAFDQKKGSRVGMRSETAVHRRLIRAAAIERRPS
jgi:hypothetical protein